MEKLIYMLRNPAEADGDALRDALIERVTPRLREGGAIHVQVNVNDSEVAQGTPIRVPGVEPPIRAMVAFWLENSDDRGDCEAALRPHAAQLDGYLTVESVPLLNRTHVVPHGQRTPGSSQTTCVLRRPDISYEEFIRIWHDDHKIVACETQTTFGYVRNEIMRPLTTGAPVYSAVVEENFPIEALTDRWVFYDSKTEEQFQANLNRMMASVERFLDQTHVEATHMSEYVLG